MKTFVFIITSSAFKVFSSRVQTRSFPPSEFSPQKLSRRSPTKAGKKRGTLSPAAILKTFFSLSYVFFETSSRQVRKTRTRTFPSGVAGPAEGQRSPPLLIPGGDANPLRQGAKGHAPPAARPASRAPPDGGVDPSFISGSLPAGSLRLGSDGECQRSLASWSRLPRELRPLPQIFLLLLSVWTSQRVRTLPPRPTRPDGAEILLLQPRRRVLLNPADPRRRQATSSNHNMLTLHESLLFMP